MKVSHDRRAPEPLEDARGSAKDWSSDEHFLGGARCRALWATALMDFHTALFTFCSYGLLDRYGQQSAMPIMAIFLSYGLLDRYGQQSAMPIMAIFLSYGLLDRYGQQSAMPIMPSSNAFGICLVIQWPACCSGVLVLPHLFPTVCDHSRAAGAQVRPCPADWRAAEWDLTVPSYLALMRACCPAPFCMRPHSPSSLGECDLTCSRQCVTTLGGCGRAGATLPRGLEGC
jgi:hypothetical protein